MNRLGCVVLASLLGLPVLLPAQDALPRVTSVHMPSLRTNVEQLLAAGKTHEALLGASVRDQLRSAMREMNEEALSATIQDILDPHCLIGITINPESRVKAARAPAPAELVQGQARAFLIKVHNDAGVTHPLVVTSSALGDQEWLKAAITSAPPLATKLNGRPLEYVVLVLSSRELGKREATLSFDVGQGTQDLGFRAEVPILFTIRPEAKRP